MLLVSSLCCHQIPCRWHLGLLQVEPSQKMNSPLHPRLVYKDVHVVAHLWGVLAGTSDPSEIGTSAASVTRVLRRGGPWMLLRPLSFLSISARLVLALMRLLIRGLMGRSLSISCTTGMHMPYYQILTQWEAQSPYSRFHHASRAGRKRYWELPLPGSGSG